MGVQVTEQNTRLARRANWLEQRRGIRNYPLSSSPVSRCLSATMIAYNTPTSHKTRPGKWANSQCKSAFSYSCQPISIRAYPPSRGAVLAFNLPTTMAKRLNCAVNGVRACGSVGQCSLRRLHVYMRLPYPPEPNMTASPRGGLSAYKRLSTRHTYLRSGIIPRSSFHSTAPA